MLKNGDTNIMIGGVAYTLILTTKATKEIGKRYGGSENLLEKIFKIENFELALDEVVWLITLLANQGIQIHNRYNPDSKMEILTEKLVELLTSLAELYEFSDAISNAMVLGTNQLIGKRQNARHLDFDFLK